MRRPPIAEAPSQTMPALITAARRIYAARKRRQSVAANHAAGQRNKIRHVAYHAHAGSYCLPAKVSHASMLCHPTLPHPKKKNMSCPIKWCVCMGMLGSHTMSLPTPMLNAFRHSLLLSFSIDNQKRCQNASCHGEFSKFCRE